MLYNTPTEIITGNQRTIPNKFACLKNLTCLILPLTEPYLTSKVKDYFQ